MNKVFRLVALLLAFMVLASGCSIITVNKEVDDQTVLAEYKGGQVTKGRAVQEFEDVKAYYASYDYPLDDEETINEIKKEIVDILATTDIVESKAKELGLYELSEEEKTQVTEMATKEYNDTLDYYSAYFSADEGEEAAETEANEDVKQAAAEFLAAQGYTEEAAVENALEQAWQDKLFNYVTEDVAATEEQIQSAYETFVEADQESFEEDAYNFEYSALSGNDIYWYPEGYRTVKHILLGFTDEQVEKLSEAYANLEDVRYQIEELDWEANNGDAAEEEIETIDLEEEASAEEAAEAETAEEELTVEESEAEDNAEAELEAADGEETDKASRDELVAEEVRLSEAYEALKAEYAATLADQVKEVQDKIATGEDFDALMEEYGSDPGMKEEPTKTSGYYVSENSQMWEAEFTETAMKLANVGDVSAPVIGSNGVHIIKYVADVTEGPVDLETVRTACEESALDNAKQETYDDTTKLWVEEAELKTYLDRWK